MLWARYKNTYQVAHPLSCLPTIPSLELSYAISMSTPVCSRSVIFLMCKTQPAPYLHFAKTTSSRKILAATHRALVAVFGASFPTTKALSFYRDDHSLFAEVLWIYTTNNYSDTIALKRNPWSVFCDDISLIILNCIWLTNADSKLMSSYSTTEPGL